MAIMIDQETWNNTTNAVVRAMAVVEFDPLTGDIDRRQLIDARPSLDDQIERGRTIGRKTVKWWKKKHPLAGHIARHAEITRHVETTHQLVAAFHDFIRPLLDEHEKLPVDLWSRGFFDIAILNDLYYSIGRTTPWRYWQERDVRTLDSLVEKQPPANPHDPLSDIDAQIKQVALAHQLAEQARAYSELMHSPDHIAA